MKLSLDAVKKSVQSALKRIPNAPTIEFQPNPGSIGLTPPNGVIPKGVTLDDGFIVIFSDAAELVIEVLHGACHSIMALRFVRNMLTNKNPKPEAAKASKKASTGNIAAEPAPEGDTPSDATGNVATQPDAKQSETGGNVANPQAFRC